MEKKTIADLNSKIWYRFLKAIFVLFGLTSILLFTAVVIIDGPKVDGIDSSKTQIHCNYARKSFSPQSVDVNLSFFDYANYSTGGVDDNNYQVLARGCPDGVWDANSHSWINEVPQPIGTPIFSVVPVYTYDYISFVRLLIIGNLVVLLLLEATRRTFYYVVLGNINPGKS